MSLTRIGLTEAFDLWSGSNVRGSKQMIWSWKYIGVGQQVDQPTYRKEWWKRYSVFQLWYLQRATGDISQEGILDAGIVPRIVLLLYRCWFFSVCFSVKRKVDARVRLLCCYNASTGHSSRSPLQAQDQSRIAMPGEHDHYVACISGNRTAMSPLCVIYRTQGKEGYCSYIYTCQRPSNV